MSENNQLQTTSNRLPGHAIKVDPLLGGTLDLSMLTEEQRREVAKRYADGMVDQSIKIVETKKDIAALESDLGIINENVNKATQGGYSMQAEQTFNTAYGKTTVIVGNTERASAGKVSGSISGESNAWLKIVVVIAIAVVLIAVFSR